MFEYSAKWCLRKHRQSEKQKRRQMPWQKKRMSNPMYERLPDRAENGKYCYKCKFCGIIDKGLGISKHIKTHHADQLDDSMMHKCNQCKRKFLTEFGYNTHMIQKHNLNNYANFCSVCKIYFANVHKNCKKNKSQCNYCEKAFHSHQKLQEHISGVHLGRNPYKCKKCSKRWPSQNGLNMHMRRVHSPQRCRMCNNTLASQYDLKKHMVLVHGQSNGAFLCSMCPKNVYFSKSTFAKHMADKHNMEIESD